MCFVERLLYIVHSLHWLDWAVIGISAGYLLWSVRKKDGNGLDGME